LYFRDIRQINGSRWSVIHSDNFTQTPPVDPSAIPLGSACLTSNQPGEFGRLPVTPSEFGRLPNFTHFRCAFQVRFCTHLTLGSSMRHHQGFSPRRNHCSSLNSNHVVSSCGLLAAELCLLVSRITQSRLLFLSQRSCPTAITVGTIDNFERFSSPANPPDSGVSATHAALQFIWMLLPSWLIMQHTWVQHDSNQFTYPPNCSTSS